MQAAAALHDRLGRHLAVWRVGNLYALVCPGKLTFMFPRCALRSFGCSGLDWVMLGVILLVGADGGSRKWAVEGSCCLRDRSQHRWASPECSASIAGDRIERHGQLKLKRKLEIRREEGWTRRGVSRVTNKEIRASSVGSSGPEHWESLGLASCDTKQSGIKLWLDSEPIDAKSCGG